MTPVIALAALAASQTQPQPIELMRVFKAGETLRYQVRSQLVTETQRIGLPYKLPADMEINYDSTLQIKEIKADGFATAIYKRPTMDLVEGETAERDRRTNRQATNINIQVSLSPINEITGVKDLNAKPSPTPTRRPGSGGSLRAALAGWGAPAAQPNIPFIQELYRLSLFVGSLDTAIDLSPPLPYDEVKPGAVWRKTASYQPQVLQGRANAQMAVQRLDWTYTYGGIVESEGRKVHRVTGTLKLASDVAKFINQIQQSTPGQSGLEALPVEIDMKVTYDLDLATRATLAAFSEAKGTWRLKLSDVEEPVLEEKLTGRTTLRLAGRS